jgi:AraC-like DNA-binding protein
MDKIYAVHNCPGLRKYFDEMMLAKNNPGGLDRRASVIFHRFLEDCHTVVYGAPDQYIPPDVTELKKILDSSVQEKVCLRDICKDIHQPEAVMIRRFREYFGATPYDYLMDRRIEEAKLLLRHTALSVKEIAARLKFSDQYYFSNYFKRKTGVSPKNHKNDFR